MLEKNEAPINVGNDIPICEVCGAVLITAQERIIRRCLAHSQKA